MGSPFRFWRSLMSKAIVVGIPLSEPNLKTIKRESKKDSYPNSRYPYSSAKNAKRADATRLETSLPIASDQRKSDLTGTKFAMR
jgi:hypothetical protein